MIAVNPRNPRNLLVASSHWRESLGREPDATDKRDRVSVLFRSMDGGKSWQEIEFHTPPKKGAGDSGGDPGIFFNKDGSAIYYEIIENRNRFYLSKDGGATWAVLGESQRPVDHVQWTANTSADPSDRTAYGLGLDTTIRPDRPDKPEYRLVLQTIDNQGRYAERDVTNGTEIGSILKSDDYIGMNSTDFMLVNRVGKAFLPFHTWSNDAGADKVEDPQRRWLITATEGGRASAPPHLITKADGTELVSSIGTWRPGYAVDTSTGPYSNRLYTTFMDAKAKNAPWGLYLSHSDDDGRTWSDPVMIEQVPLMPSEDNKDSAFPIVSVNDQGVVMVSWFRDSAGPEKEIKWLKKTLPVTLSRRMVTASLDGGKTFLATVPLSTKTVEQNNYHYMGIASDITGRMHALWADRRLGPDMLFHASAVVTCNGKPAKAQRPAR